MLQQSAVQSYLRQLVAQAMYMDESDVKEDELFSNFGLESLTLLKLVEKINSTYGVAVKASEVLQHQTLRDASSFLFGEIRQQQEKKKEMSE